jgi:hypothetical protein
MFTKVADLWKGDVVLSIEAQTCLQNPDSNCSLQGSISVSAENLRILEHASPTSSRSSLERYLDSMCPIATPSGLPGCSTTPADHPKLDYTAVVPPDNLADAVSVIGSDRSLSSAGSNSSRGSHRSDNSRGSRRGRRSWAETQGSMAHGRYFCTWPDCAATFTHRYQWTRHEEAIHYCPYRWVCCSTNPGSLKLYDCFICGETNGPLLHLASVHFTSCAQKPEQERTFYRQDQLSQHIARTHCKDQHRKIPEDLLVACRSANPDFQESSLRCGFCGLISSSWTQRQNHVFAHLHEQKWMKKVAWQSDRLYDARLAVIGDMDNLSGIYDRTIAEISVWSCAEVLDGSEYQVPKRWCDSCRPSDPCTYLASRSKKPPTFGPCNGYAFYSEHDFVHNLKRDHGRPDDDYWLQHVHHWERMQWVSALC